MALAPLLSEAPFRYCPWCGQHLAAGSRRDEALLAKYRKRIVENFFTTDDWGMPDLPNMLLAARPVADYRQLTGDILGTLDLMLAFVETGTRFTAVLATLYIRSKSRQMYVVRPFGTSLGQN